MLTKEGDFVVYRTGDFTSYLSLERDGCEYIYSGTLSDDVQHQELDRYRSSRLALLSKKGRPHILLPPEYCRQFSWYSEMLGLEEGVDRYIRDYGPYHPPPPPPPPPDPEMLKRDERLYADIDPRVGF